MKEFAPIALFVYKRLEKTIETWEALKGNIFADKSDVYIFSDGAKDDKDKADVESVRRYFSENSDGFRKVTLIERENNWGLADNIISGITEVLRYHDRVIVLEDDIVTSSFFLDYMNKALNRYRNDKRVFEVCSEVYPYFEYDKSKWPESFFLTRSDCWGWGIWADRWKYYVRDPEEALKRFDTKEKIHDFNLKNDFLWYEIANNYFGSLHTWAIFLNLMIYEHKGLVLYPRLNYSKNIGMDYSGEHCGYVDIDAVMLANAPFNGFPIDVGVNDFVSEQKISIFLSHKREFDDFINDADSVVIYGAGIVGKNIMKYMRNLEKAIESFAVTDVGYGEKIIDGIPVVDIKEVPISSNVVIAASRDKDVQQMINVLEEMGVKKYTCVDQYAYMVIKDVIAKPIFYKSDDDKSGEKEEVI